MELNEGDPVMGFDRATDDLVLARAGGFVQPPSARLLFARGRAYWAWGDGRRVCALLPSTEGIRWARGHDDETAAALRAAKKLADTANSSS